MASLLKMLAGLLLAGAGFMIGRLGSKRRDSDLKTGNNSPPLHPQEEEREKIQLDGVLAYLSALLGRGTTPTGRIPRREFAETLVDAASALLDAENVLWLETERATFDLTARAGRGVSPEILRSLRVHPGDGLLGRAAQAGNIVLVYDTGAVISPKPHEQFLTAPYVGVPVRIQSRLAGLLVLWKPRRGLFGAETSRLATLLASQTSRTLENLDLTQDLQSIQEELLQSLTQALEAKDTTTRHHSERTRALVRAMGQEIRLPEPLIQQVEYGALLHDIGKIGIADAILSKTGKLTVDEYAAMKKHPEIGQRILASIGFLKPASSIVLYHQEWYNGQGYPEGLAGEEIPLGARLVSVLDAWDAMTSERPYRKAMPKASGVAELRRQAGTQFDPKMVDAFLRVIERLERDGVAVTENKPEEVRA